MDGGCSLAAWTRAHLTVVGYFTGRVLGRSFRSFQDSARDRFAICAAETETVKPPRIRNAERIVDGRSNSGVRAYLEQTAVEHAATEAFVLRNVALVGNRLYTGASNLHLWRSESKRAGVTEVEELADVVFASTYSGARWFGHFIHDELPLQMLAPALGAPVANARPIYEQEPAYRSIFGVAPPARRRAFFARRCTVLEDYAQNSSKRARYRRMQSNVRRALGSPTRVYARRVGGRARTMRDEDRVAAALSRLGFEIISNADPIERIVDACTRAVQLVSTDSSHVAPMLFLMPRGGEFVQVNAPVMTTNLLDVARALGHRTAVYVGQGVREEFGVDLNELAGFVEAD